MIIYIILIALLNLCVGYYAAVHLGFGQTWWSPGQAGEEAEVAVLPVAGESVAGESVAGESQVAEPATDTSAAEISPVEQQADPGEGSSAPDSDPSASAAFEALAAASDEPDVKEEPETPEESQEAPPVADTAADDDTNDDTNDKAIDEPIEDSEAPSDSSHIEEDVLAVVESCAADFKRELGQYRTRLGEIDSQARDGTESGQAEQLQECVDGLKNANNKFVDKQGGILQRLNSQEDHDALSGVAADVERAMAEQGALAKSSNINLEQIDVENDPEAGFQRLIGETSALSDSASQAHQTIQDAQESISEVRQNLGEPAAEETSQEEASREKESESHKKHEDVTQLLNAWWKDDPERSRDLTVGVIAVDKASQFQERLGGESTEKLFDALRTMIEDAVGQRGPVIRHSFHVFVVLLHDTEPRESTNIAEHVRQTVAAAKFTHHESHIPVTVSCVATPAKPDDSAATIVQRIDTMLEESNRYGENRTYLHEDAHPSPVVPPQLDVDEVTVRL
jgi:diguanylate cyclase (GGDEF)-like protein